MTGRRRRNPNSATRKYKTLIRRTRRLLMSTLAVLWNILKLPLCIYIAALAFLSIFFSFAYVVENTEIISSVPLIEIVADFRMAEEKYDTAFGLWTRIHRINRREFGSSHEKTINALSQLGSISLLQNRTDEARHFFMKVYGKRQKKLGEDHPETKRALNELANVQSNFVVEKVVCKIPDCNSDSDSKTSTSLDSPSNPEPIGYIMAEEMIKQMLTSSKSVFGEFNSQATTYTNTLALHLYDKGRIEEALSLSQTTYEKYRSFYGAAHSETIYILMGLGRVLLQAGRIAEAEKLVLENFEEQQQKQQQQKQEGSTAKMNKLRVLPLQMIGQYYATEKKYAESERVLRKVYNFYRALFGEEHKLTLESLEEVLYSMTRQKGLNTGQALELFKILLKRGPETWLNIKQDGDAEKDADFDRDLGIAVRLSKLAMISDSLENFEISLKLSSQICEILEETTGDEPVRHETMRIALKLIHNAHRNLGNGKELMEISNKIQQFQLENERENSKDFHHGNKKESTAGCVELGWK